MVEVGQRTKDLSNRQKIKVSFTDLYFLIIFLKIHGLFMDLGENSQEYIVIQNSEKPSYIRGDIIFESLRFSF